MPVHHFTVDVEEHFQVTALESAVPRESWALQPSRVRESTLRLMDVLDRAAMRGTFFVLGWVADRQPGLVREIAAAGHEVASHGWDHHRIPQQRPEAFRESVRRTKAVLEDLTGRAVHGFRAPSFSLVPGTEWALDVLGEEGYRYDSSLFPVRRRGYGYPGTPRDLHRLTAPKGHELFELPPATLRTCGFNVPAGGGAYFRLLPYRLTRAALLQAERRGAPATFYIHPWELDPGQPRLRVDALTRVRHYGALARTESRLTRLLAGFRFQAIEDTLELARDVVRT